MKWNADGQKICIVYEDGMDNFSEPKFNRLFLISRDLFFPHDDTGTILEIFYSRVSRDTFFLKRTKTLNSLAFNHLQ